MVDYDEEELVDYEADEEEEEEEEEEVVNHKTTHHHHHAPTPTTTSSDDNNPPATLPAVVDDDKLKSSSSKGGGGNATRSTRGNDAPSSSSSAGKRNPSIDMRGYYEDDNRVKKLRVSDEQHHPNNHNDRTHTTTPPSTTTIRAGNASFGVYIPPFRRRRQLQLLHLQRPHSPPEPGQEPPPTIPPYQTQRTSWETLKKTIHGTINRLNATTIKPLIHSLISNANLVRGRGLLSKSLLRATTASPTFAPVYAALIAVINTKLPEIGELLLARGVLAFRRAYARRDRRSTMAIARFLGEMFNQGLCHELLCLQILTLLLEGDPTDDSVEVGVVFMEVVGVALLETSPAGVHAVMELFRGLLHDGGAIGRRVQYKVEELMKKRRNRFGGLGESVRDELDLVEREDQICHEVMLDDDGLRKEEGLDVFKFDDKWDENERAWREIRDEIVGGDTDDDTSGSAATATDDDEDSLLNDSDSNSDNDSNNDGHNSDTAVLQNNSNSNHNRQLTTTNSNSTKLTTVIHDMTEQDLIHLRRTIYLTIMSSATFEECTHKLTKIDIPPGKESELINMIIECCSQERTFLRYYGLISGRFCLLHERWRTAFHTSFTDQYATIHRLGTNKLRNVAKMFAHLLHTDSLPWSCLEVVHLNEDETTSSSRIFLKILVQEMAGAMGMAKLVSRFGQGEGTGSSSLTNTTNNDDTAHTIWYAGMFPKDIPRNTRYAINFFTSIGLGPLTDGLREHLKNAPKLIRMQAEKEAAERAVAAQRREEEEEEDSSSVSSATVSSSSVSSSSTDISTSTYDSYSSSGGSYSSYSTSSSVSYRRKRRGGEGNGGEGRGGERRGGERQNAKDRSKGRNDRRDSRPRSNSSSYHRKDGRRGQRSGGGGNSRPRSNSVSYHRKDGKDGRHGQRSGDGGGGGGNSRPRSNSSSYHRKDGKDGRRGQRSGDGGGGGGNSRPRSNSVSYHRKDGRRGQRNDGGGGGGDGRRSSSRRDRMVSRSRSHSRPRSRSHSRPRSRSYSRPRSRSKSMSHPRPRSRSKSMSRSRPRSRSKSMSRSHSRSKSMSRSRSKKTKPKRDNIPTAIHTRRSQERRDVQRKKGKGSSGRRMEQRRERNGRRDGKRSRSYSSYSSSSSRSK